MTQAQGTFDVTLTPLALEHLAADPTLGMLSIAKRFYGDLDGTSVGTMLSAATDVDGSAGYVAIERFSGTLAGHRGTFALQHNGTMTRGAPQLTITVVPDTGTDALTGLAGTMTLTRADGVHRYAFEYAVQTR